MASPTDLGFDLIPPDPGVISPDLALDAALAPVIDLGQPEPDPIGKGWSFNFLTGQFARNGAAPAEVYQLDNLRVWIEKAMRTARNAHSIYGPTFGMEDPDRLIGQLPDGDLIAAYQDDVVETLTAHDRIAAVDGFYFQHDPFDDALFVSFQVTLDAEAEQVIQVDSLQITPSLEFATA